MTPSLVCLQVGDGPSGDLVQGQQPGAQCYKDSRSDCRLQPHLFPSLYVVSVCFLGTIITHQDLKYELNMSQKTPAENLLPAAFGEFQPA